MPSRWWEGRPEEIYWVEVTDRSDLGKDLAAPQEAEDGGSHWSYDLVNEVLEGDVVLHYETRPVNRIATWSRAVGKPYEDYLTWGAHGQASGRGPVDPYERPAWRRPLDGPFLLEREVSMEDFRESEDAIRDIHERLKESYSPRALYFPFQLSDTRPVRAFQGYIAKMPRDLLLAVPQLAPLVELAESSRPTAIDPAPLTTSRSFGVDYRRPEEEVATTRERDPQAVDPNLVDRALRAHRRTQNLLHDHLFEVGFEPRSPGPGEPEFDLGWEDGEVTCIAEVKSLSDTNEEKQLRLALGQVLRYAHLLESVGRDVRRFIVTEREPQDSSWSDLASSLGVALIWPETFDLIDGTG
jgi:hypothetical protein